MNAECRYPRPRMQFNPCLIATMLFWAIVASSIGSYAAEAGEVECDSVEQRWDDEGYFWWRGRVDGVDEIAIKGSSIRIRHISAKPIQEQDYRFGSPLPRDEVDVYLNVIEGRGNVRLIQEPSRSNDYTAVVRVDDGTKGGDALYELELTWRQRPRFRDDTWSSGSAWGDEESFQWRGLVDGVDEIVIRDRSVRIRHIAAKPIQHQDYRFSAPLSQYETDCRLNVIEGRGRVRLIQEPSRSNDYTAVIRVDDGDKGGDAYYELELVWTPQKYVWGGTTDNYASFHWKGRVDIGAVVRIRGNEHRIEDLGGDGARELEARFSEPLPQTDVPVSVRKLDGRGKVELVEMPGPANGYTAVVRIEDEKSGADTYEFELTWQR